MKDVTHERLQEEYVASVIRVGDALGSSGDFLSKYTELHLVEDEKFYTPLPPLKVVDGTVIASVHPEAIGIWADVLDEAAGVTHRDARQLYFASTAALVELSFLSFTAKHEREFEGTEGMTAKALGRAASIASRFFNKDEVVLLAEDLEKNHGLSGIAPLAEYLRDSDILEINRMRYAIASAYFALDINEAEREEITAVFRKRLMTEMGRYNDVLLKFLEAFSSSEQDYAKFQSNMDRLKSRSMAHFLVAGSSPMGF